MIFVGFRWGEVGESDAATLGKGLSGREVGKCTGVMERLRFGCGRVGMWRGRAPSMDGGPARGEETEGREASVADIGRVVRDVFEESRVNLTRWREDSPMVSSLLYDDGDRQGREL